MRGQWGGKFYEIRRSREFAERVGARTQRLMTGAGSLPARREDPAVASRRAGARGMSAPGVDYVDRLSHYQVQNGPPYRRTPRQERRQRHKAHHQEAQARRAIDRRAWLAKAAGRG